MHTIFLRLPLLLSVTVLELRLLRANAKHSVTRTKCTTVPVFLLQSLLKIELSYTNKKWRKDQILMIAFDEIFLASIMKDTNYIIACTAQ